MDEDLRRYLTGEVGPDRAASYLINRWTHAEPATAEGMLWITSLVNWSLTQRWAWDALQRLLRALRYERQPIPLPLREWADGVAVGDRPRPGQGPGRRSNEERDFRIWIVVRTLVREQGKLQAEAHTEVSAALPHENLSPSGIKSICQRMRVARPFPIQK